MDNGRRILIILEELLENVCLLFEPESYIVEKFEEYLIDIQSFPDLAAVKVYNAFTTSLQEPGVMDALKSHNTDFFIKMDIKQHGQIDILSEIQEIQKAIMECDETSQKMVWQYIDLMMECV